MEVEPAVGHYLYRKSSPRSRQERAVEAHCSGARLERCRWFEKRVAKRIWVPCFRPFSFMLAPSGGRDRRPWLFCWYRVISATILTRWCSLMRGACEFVSFARGIMCGSFSLCRNGIYVKTRNSNIHSTTLRWLRLLNISKRQKPWSFILNIGLMNIPRCYCVTSPVGCRVRLSTSTAHFLHFCNHELRVAASAHAPCMVLITQESSVLSL